MNTLESKRNARSGIAVDAQGGPVVDPTTNVLQLVNAAVDRLNDLRDSDFKWSQLLHSANERRLDEQMKLHSDFSDKLSLAESKRIDAIRAVDVSAVAVASERATQQAAVLANQVTTSADALRTLVATTAATMATQTQNLTTQFTDRLASLEKSQYENKGKSGLTDPMLQELIGEVRGLRDSRETSTGKASGMSTSWAMLIGAIGLIALLLGMWNNFNKGKVLNPASPTEIVVQPAR